MHLTDYSFLLLCFLSLAVYYLLPGRFQWMALLAASLLFYLSTGIGNLVFMAVTILSTYLAALLISRNHRRLAALPKEKKKQEKPILRRKNRAVLIVCMVLNFGMLAVCKVRVLSGILLPMGISFYLFQSMGYLIDVCRGSIQAEISPARFSLFIAWFPQLIQGPISRFSQLQPQFFQPHSFDGANLRSGLWRMLWGYFKKLVVADRIAVAVAVLRGPEYTGLSFLVLTIFYAIQIYGDFTGGIDIVLGLSQCFGITMTENFRRPFFSKNIAEFWRRWHISLGEWMKDYVFYPISVSGPMRKLSKAVKSRFGKRLPVYIATVVTWLVTGIWHGFSPNFLLWGMLNCGVIILSEELAPLYRRFHAGRRFKGTALWNCFEILRTFLLMNLIRIVDLFPDVGEYFRRLGGLFSSLRVPFGELGLTGLDGWILFFAVCLMLLVSLLQARVGSVRQWLTEKPTPLRFGLAMGLLLAVLLMGRYGIGYDAGSFIYNQF